MSEPDVGSSGRVPPAPEQVATTVLTGLLDRSSDGLLVFAPDGHVLAANPTAQELLGRDETELRGARRDAVADPEDDRWSRVVAGRAAELSGAEIGESRTGELRMRHADGSTFPVEASWVTVSDDGAPRVALIFSSQAHEVDQVTRAGEMQRAAATVIDTLESISDAYVALDKHWVITYLNGRAAELLQMASRWDAFGHDVWEFFPELAGSPAEEHYRAVMTTGEPVEFETYWAPADLRCEVRVYPLQGGGMGVYFQDIADRYEARREREWLLTREQAARAAAESAQRELAVRATRDNVTGLLNRWGLLEEVERAMAADLDVSLTVMFIDLDRFKLVNDTLGHVVGDQLLAVIGKRLTGLVRPTDLLARFGGDEFVIVLQNTPPARAEDLARRIVAATAEPVAVGRSISPVTASVGIARAEGGSDINTLLSEADAALYRVKDAGRDGYAWFDELLHRETVQRVQTERDLREALAVGDQLTLHYQPAYDLVTGRASHVEALSRWHHPKRGLVPPGEFIPVAEESGLVLTLGERVIAEAIAQASRWSHVPDVRVWVNVSPRHLALPGLADVIERLLDDAGVPGGRFGIEVTESVIADDDRFVANLQAVKTSGVSVAIDDFGTGYSSLSRLARTPVDVIKIDQSFVRAIGTPTGDAMLTGIVSLAHSLGSSVIAEGVETSEQLHAVTDAGADAAAGYLLARPCPPEGVDLVRTAVLGTRFAGGSVSQVT